MVYAKGCTEPVWFKFADPLLPWFWETTWLSRVFPLKTWNWNKVTGGKVSFKGLRNFTKEYYTKCRLANECQQQQITIFRWCSSVFFSSHYVVIILSQQELVGCEGSIYAVNKVNALGSAEELWKGLYSRKTKQKETKTKTELYLISSPRQLNAVTGVKLMIGRLIFLVPLRSLVSPLFHIRKQTFTLIPYC